MVGQIELGLDHGFVKHHPNFVTGSNKLHVSSPVKHHMIDPFCSYYLLGRCSYCHGVVSKSVIVPQDPQYSSRVSKRWTIGDSKIILFKALFEVSRAVT